MAHTEAPETATASEESTAVSPAADFVLLFSAVFVAAATMIVLL